ncbi:hypothetical protein MNBD_ACTINO02-3103 [hydrothermal vent metagenome]|uniref:DUF58 domain-containing protein n=1 Tax=hydrothermal vent metagenome TaxID=652676 RepID=A0A3B0SGR4_9ZZZZ
MPTARSALATAGAALLAIPFGGIAGTIAVLLVITLTVVDALEVRNPPLITGEIPQHLARGYEAKVEYTVATQHRFQLRQPGTPDITVRPQGPTSATTFTLVATRRGAHRLPSVVVRSFGRWGLGAWTHQPRAAVTITVFPDVITARRIAHAVARGSLRQGERVTRRIGLGTAFDSVREYVPGDDFRHINWRAMLRTGQPMTNVFNFEQDRNVLCLIDQGRLMGGDLGGKTRLDAAIDAAVAVGYVADTIGDRVGFMTFDRSLTHHLAPRRRGGEALMRGLHALEPTTNNTRFDEPLQIAIRAKRSFVLIFTDLLDAAASQALLRAVPLLTRHHSVAVVSSIDPELEDATLTDPETTFDAFVSVAAHEALNQQLEVVDQLRNLGAQPIVLRAADLPIACVKHYLDLKDRARV